MKTRRLHLDITRTLLMPKTRYVVSTRARFFKPEKIILHALAAHSVLVHDVAIDGKSAWALGFKGPLPGDVFAPLAVGVFPFEERIAQECVLLTVTNESREQVWFGGEIVGMQSVPPS